MKLQVRKQFICYIVAFILLLSGVWMEMPSADVSFLHAQETTNTESEGSVLSNGIKSVKLERVGTIDVFRRDITACLSSNRVQNGIKYLAHNVAFFSAVVILLICLLCYGYLQKCSTQSLPSSHTAIIMYIQQKDGKK